MTRLFLRSLLCSLVLLASGAPNALAQDPAQFFRQNCTACHTVGGGRITGPDLKGVSGRKDRQWLVRFIVNPKAVIDSWAAASKAPSNCLGSLTTRMPRPPPP